MDRELEASRSLARQKLEEVAQELTALGIPRPALDGKILRPLTAYLLVPRALRSELDERFWRGALAVEMVHEASLLHDDILDDAPERRGRPTLFASAGVGPALVLGDHLLTGAYRMAASAGSPPFLETFIRAVERTVAGEISQERAQGKILTDDEYRANITGKSGELFRAVFTLGPSLLDLPNAEAAGSTGAWMGCIYQMVDDALDYCPDADRGKIPLQDYRQKKWTWPLGLLDLEDFETPGDQVLEALFKRPLPSSHSPLERGALFLEREATELLNEVSSLRLEAQGISHLLAGWVEQVRRVTAMEADRFSPEAKSARPNAMHQAVAPGTVSHLDGVLESEAKGLESPSGRMQYFGNHAKTFRFASRLFPEEALQSVAGVYAFCRFTDDLVDEAKGAPPLWISSRLDRWGALSRRAYHGDKTGIGLLDQVMGEMRSKKVPFSYAQELLEGVRMDLEPRNYHTLEDLRQYSFRVASVVGGWLTELFGVHDPWVLDRAFSLGHAMQLTNILRDVGEDLAQGRIYLPRDRMTRFGVDEPLLRAMALHGAPVFPGYRALLDDLMQEAESEYRRSFAAIPALPPFFRGPVAVASRAYEAIHEEIQRNDYDNLTKRARTSLPKKIGSAFSAILQLRRLQASPSLGKGSTAELTTVGRKEGQGVAA
jgi:phytoene synthase